MWACQTYAGIAGTKKHFVTSEAMKNRRIVAEHLLKAAAESDVDLVNLEVNVSIKCICHLPGICGVCSIFHRASTHHVHAEGSHACKHKGPTL